MRAFLQHHEHGWLSCTDTFLEKSGLLPFSFADDEEDGAVDAVDLEPLRTCANNHNKWRYVVWESSERLQQLVALEARGVIQ